MRSLVCSLALVLLSGCSGGDTAPAAVVTPPVQVVPPAIPALTNTNVQCGEWSQQLSLFTPPYSRKNHQRWVIMGSSSAFGAGASSYAQSWAGRLTAFAQTEQIEVVNIAKGGYTTYHALASRCEVSATRFQPDANHNVDRALALNPDLVILSFPSNDAASSYLAAESAFNLLLMRELLVREKVAAVLVGAQPRNMAADKQRLLVQLDTLLAERVAACLVQVYQPLVDAAGNLSPAYNSGDGVHLNDAGHAIIYERLLKVLTEPAAGCFV